MFLTNREKEMKKYFENVNKWQVLSMLLFVMAIAFGGGAMAMPADMVESPINNPGPDSSDTTTGAHTAGNDPADPDVNDRMIPGDGYMGQDTTGSQASSSQQTKQENIDDEWDTNLTQFQPWRNPMLSIARKVARKQKISNWMVKHGKVGGETLDGKTKTAIAAGDVITLTPQNFSGSLRPFYKHSTIMVPKVPGYKRGSSSEIEGGLMLYVIDSNGKDSVKCQAVNGPLKDGVTSPSDNLDDMTCPAIPAGTYMCAGATACSESQLLVAPENFQPREEEFYVQKKLLNIVFTEDFEKAKKRVPIQVSDIKADAIYKYNMRAERTYWYGTQSRFWTTHKDGSEELVYTTKGCLWQLTNTYAVQRGEVTRGDLIAISKLQHTTFSQSDHSYAFMGKNFTEWVLNMDLGKDNIVNIRDYHDDELKLDFKRLKTTFGTTDFIYDKGLDMLGLEDACVILDLNGATRYVKTAEKERTNDMSKGAGEIRDAKRIIHEEADGIALRGYNSIFVAPTDIAFALPDSQIRSNVVSSATLPANPTAGMIVALTATVEQGGTTYEAGTVWEYKNNAWAEYTGYTTAV